MTFYYNTISFPILYTFIPNKKVWDNVVKKQWNSIEEYPSEKLASCCILNDDNGAPVCFVTVSETYDNKEQIEEIYSIITHEAVHVYQELVSYIGEDTPSIEFEAYAIQSIAENLLKQFKKARLKNGKD